MHAVFGHKIFGEDQVGNILWIQVLDSGHNIFGPGRLYHIKCFYVFPRVFILVLSQVISKKGK